AYYFSTHNDAMMLGSLRQKENEKTSATSTCPRHEVAASYRLHSMRHILSQRGTSSIIPKQ
ncbi:hypothetical protein ACTVMP_21490, partial [Serratia marcescens]|uniref:hypothetical protein n=1 Tax=Serratia marcescens TaxID=615 RepID=UPI003FA79C83